MAFPRQSGVSNKKSPPCRLTVSHDYCGRAGANCTAKLASVCSGCKERADKKICDGMMKSFRARHLIILIVILAWGYEYSYSDGISPLGPWCANTVKCDKETGRCDIHIKDKCEICNGTFSPVFVATGNYFQSTVDLSLPAVGVPLTAFRKYDSSHPIMSAAGMSWMSSVSARLSYTVYLYSAPSTFLKEADIVMPNV